MSQSAWCSEDEAIPASLEPHGKMNREYLKDSNLLNWVNGMQLDISYSKNNNLQLNLFNLLI